ncbi:hypothetical protein BDQ17DRAFT_1508033 [Cyathus striatus]|nr:hypothetical protein BDQ17DRAFT_1508033 [Cyathus striatus]
MPAVDRRLQTAFQVMRSHAMRHIKGEHELYGIITEALLLHKTEARFIIFPQLFIRWSKRHGEKQSTTADFCIGIYDPDNFTSLRLFGGIEVKHATLRMTTQNPFPTELEMEEDRTVQTAIHDARFQAEEQAKSAVKLGYLPKDQPVSWLIFCGPFFTKWSFGPFTPAQLITRSTRPNGSGDYHRAVLVIEEFLTESASLPYTEPYLISERADQGDEDDSDE